MSSWRPLVAGTVGLFLIILAFLAGQLHAGGDPALRTSGTAATEQTAPQATPEPQRDSGPQGSGSDPGVPYGSAPNGAAPDGINHDGTTPDGSTPDLSPPTTHQS
jgi:hypothetical protein